MKTVSEEYTPLHLAARFKPPKMRQESVEDSKDDKDDESDDSKVQGTTEADGGVRSCLTRRYSREESTMGYLLKECKGINVRESL